MPEPKKVIKHKPFRTFANSGLDEACRRCGRKFPRMYRDTRLSMEEGIFCTATPVCRHDNRKSVPAVVPPAKRKPLKPRLATHNQEDVVFDTLIKRYTKRRDFDRLRHTLDLYYDVLTDRPDITKESL